MFVPSYITQSPFDLNSFDAFTVPVIVMKPTSDAKFTQFVSLYVYSDGLSDESFYIQGTRGHGTLSRSSYYIKAAFQHNSCT